MIMKDQQKTEYLKEALRLAELRLEEQNITLTLQEKKAVLIATLCIALIGFLLTFTGDIEQVSRALDCLIGIKPSIFWASFVFKILPSLILAVAMLHSIQSLNLAKLGIRGAAPGYTLNDYFDRDLYRLAKGLLKDYDDRIKRNIKTLKIQDTEMKKAKNWLFIGIPVAIFLVAVREMLQSVDTSIL